MEKFLMEIIAQKAMAQDAQVKVTFDNSHVLPYEPKMKPIIGKVAQVEDRFCMLKTPFKSLMEPSWDRVCYYMFMEEIEIIQSHN